MERNWTDEQLDAINARGGALIVSAAAGSGKTAVLVERVIRRVCDENEPISLDRLLAVTYTKAAAAEMRERIGEAIFQRLKLDPLNPYLLRQQALLPRANISTIDSFCGNLVREYFYLSDVSNDYRIGEKSELSLLKADALSNTLNRFYKSGDTEFFKLVRAFSTSKSDENLEKLLLRLYDFLSSHPFSGKWIKKMLKNYNLASSASETVWGKTAINYARGALEYLNRLCVKSLALIQNDTYFTEKLSGHLNICLGIVKNAEAAVKSGDWEKIRSAVSADIPTYPRLSGYANHPVNLSVKETQSALREIFKKFKELFAFDSEEIMEQLNVLRPMIEQMFACVTDFTEEFGKLKKQKNIADFSDLEHWALELLVNETKDSYEFSELSKQLSDRFDEVMVDEYQDANEVQDMIFRAISNDGKKLFVVGDVKQSIYRFRQAMPEIFIGRKNSSARYDRKAQIFPASVVLGKNFRSRGEITETVNFIFRLLMHREISEMEYTADEELKAGAKYPEADSPCVDFTVIDLKKCGGEDANSTEAAVIAEKILSMKKNGFTVTENGRQRPLEFGDIAILMRSPNKNAAPFVNVLKAYGIPLVCEKTENFFDVYEVRALLNLLRVISNPVQDIPLLAVLMSPLYGFSSDDIAQIRINSRKTSLYSALISASENAALPCRERAARFLEEISRLRTYSATLNVREIISRIFDDIGFRAVISAGKDGYDGDKNLEMFCEYAAAYEKSGRRGLSAFLNHMDRLSENALSLSVAADAHASFDNTVKIMSIHKSKGLEFPVCIFANTANGFNKIDARQRVLIDSRLGIASKMHDDELSCFLPTIAHRSMVLEIQKNLCSEELCLLYVALTRTREKLIITSTLNDVEKSVRKAAAKIIDNKIPAFNVQNSNCFSDWLLACALLHPDAHHLRSIAQFDDYEIPDSSNIPLWNFEIVENLSDPTDEAAARELTPEETAEPSDSDLLETLRKYSEFEYPLKEIENLPVKVSASEIAHRNIKDLFRPTLSVPAFLKQEKSTSAQKGTAVHKFLQLCDFKNARNDMNAEIKRLTDNGSLSLAEADAVKEKNPSSFFASQLAKEAMDSDEIFREYTFMVSIDAGLIDPDIKPPFDKRQVMMQGSVDLAYLLKDGTLAIADYKTDRIKCVEELLERYEIQLRLYKNAMEQSTERKVSKCVLYSIYLGESIEI